MTENYITELLFWELESHKNAVNTSWGVAMKKLIGVTTHMAGGVTLFSLFARSVLTRANSSATRKSNMNLIFGIWVRISTAVGKSGSMKRRMNSKVTGVAWRAFRSLTTLFLIRSKMYF